MALVLMAQTVGSEQRYGGSGHSQSSVQTAGRGTVQSTPTPPPQGKGQTPPVPPGGQRPQPNAEEFLTRFDWWKDEAIKKEVKLTDQQVRRIQGIIESRVKQITPTYEEYRKQVALLDQTIKDRTADLATFEVQVGRVEFLRSKVNETRTIMLYRIMRELDPAQYQKLREILDRPRGGRGGVPPRRTW
jgi:hypothetical protein